MLAARFGLSCKRQAMTHRLQRDLSGRHYSARTMAPGSAAAMSTFGEHKSCLKSNGCPRDLTSDFLTPRPCWGLDGGILFRKKELALQADRPVGALARGGDIVERLSGEVDGQLTQVDDPAEASLLWVIRRRCER